MLNSIFIFKEGHCIYYNRIQTLIESLINLLHSKNSKKMPIHAISSYKHQPYKHHCYIFEKLRTTVRAATRGKAGKAWSMPRFWELESGIGCEVVAHCSKVKSYQQKISSTKNVTVVLVRWYCLYNLAKITYLLLSSKPSAESLNQETWQV